MEVSEKRSNTTETNPKKRDEGSKEPDVGNKMRNETISNTANKQLSKKDKALSNPRVLRWYQNLARRSKVTAEVRLRKVLKFTEDIGHTPVSFADLAEKDEKAATDMLQDMVTRLEDLGLSGGYIKAIITSTKSWLAHNDVIIKRKINITNVDATPTLAGERVPEAEEMTEIFNRCNLRQAACISLIAKAGLRPESLGNFDATDGLVISDLHGIGVINGAFAILEAPVMIKVRSTISKTRHPYLTFLTSNGAKKLVAYLNERLLAGEYLGPDAAVIAPYTQYKVGRGKNKGKKFLVTSVIEHDIRKALRPRFKFRPYVFRAFFATQLLIAESRGLVARDFKSTWMGHQNSIEQVYSTNKGILPRALMEEMKSAFLRCQKLLDIEVYDRDPTEDERKDVTDRISRLSDDELSKVSEFLSSNRLGGGKSLESHKSDEGSELSQPTKPSN